jgi:hypothetical protein
VVVPKKLLHFEECASHYGTGETVVEESYLHRRKLANGIINKGNLELFVLERLHVPFMISARRSVRRPAISMTSGNAVRRHMPMHVLLKNTHMERKLAKQ